MMDGRLLFSAASSGSGKTTLVCGLMAALKSGGYQVRGFKSGPDYIDPMMHQHILGTVSHNLDLFLMGEEGVGALLAQAEGDVAVIEGAMGFYDGIALGARASAYDLARKTQTPVVLVVRGKGAALSLAATIQGFMNFRPDSQIKGVIFNEISPMFYPMLKETIEKECEIPVFGYFPSCPQASFESRHLGLATGDTGVERAELEEKIKILGEYAQTYLDLEGLLALSKTAPPLAQKVAKKAITGAKIPLAVAKDKAFSFYYQDNFTRLEEAGFCLVPFSPLEDEDLPLGVCGLYLGGGYPEIYAKELSENRKICAEIRQKIEGGLPTIGECGGFLYLHDDLEDIHGQVYPMVGLIKGRGFATKKLSRFGYVCLSLEKSGLLGEKGAKIPAHQFHYWDTTNLGEDFLAEKPESKRHWREGHMTETFYGGFPHLHFAAEPDMVERFFVACQKYGLRQP